MSFVSIPLVVLESPKFLGMTESTQKFLIDLYVVFHDTERFTIDLSAPAKYRQPARTTLNLKVARLIRSGFIAVVGHTGRPGHEQRVFSFVHPALEALEAA